MLTRIYGLYDENGDIRYIGKTIRELDVRLYHHLLNSEKPKTHKECWIRSMLNNGLSPTISLLNEFEGDGNFEEIGYIDYYRRLCANLTNIAAGGSFGATSDMARRAWDTKRKRGTDIIGIRKGLETRKRNGTDVIGTIKMVETRRKNGTYIGQRLPHFTPEIYEKIWATKRKNGTDRPSKESLLKRVATCRKNNVYEKREETKRRRGTDHWTMDPEKRMNSVNSRIKNGNLMIGIEKMWATRHKNGTATTSANKAWETRRKNGTVKWKK